MVISIMGIPLYAKVFPLYNVLREWLCCCLQANYIVYKHFDRSLHIWVLDPTCVQISDLYLLQQQEAEELEKWTFCHISHVGGPILTKI